MNLAETLQAGSAAHQAGKLTQAETHYQAVLRAMPTEFNALHLMGVVRLQQDRLPEAVDFLQKAIAQNAKVAVAQFNLGLALTGAARHAEAFAAFDAALAVDPTSGEAHEARGNALAQLGRNEDALAAWQAALTVVPQSASLLTKVGRGLVSLNRHAEAIDPLKRALALEPKATDTLRDFMACVASLGRFAEALPVLDRVLAANPTDADSHCARGLMLEALGRHEEAMASLGKAMTLAPDRTSVLTETLRTRAFNCDWRDDGAFERLRANLDRGDVIEPMTALELFDDPAILYRNAVRFSDQRFPPAKARKLRTPYRHDKIRLAYLSADYGAHVVSAVSVDLIERHDRARFEVTGLSYGPEDRSPLRARIAKAFDAFHDVAAWSDEAIAQWMADHEIDVAIDLTGHCAHGRPGISAYRGAPVQVSYLGYSGPHGAASVDYILCDRFVTPLALQHHYRERIAAIPECYLVPDSRRDLPPAAPGRREAGLPERGVVFCCFNNVFKITGEIFALWMRVLKRVDGSVVWLRCDRQAARDNLTAAAQDHGVAPERLIFAPRASEAAHVARLGTADLFLDTPHYNAHVTAIDALWAGLPLITCPGKSFSARVAASVLRAAGLPELIVDTLPAYEDLAVALARDPPRLAGLRARTVVARTSALFDSALTCRHIEGAYRQMVDISQTGAPPRSFELIPRYPYIYEG